MSRPGHAGIMVLLVASLALPGSGCDPTGVLAPEDTGIEGELSASGVLGKSDSANVAGLPSSLGGADTEVWAARNQWEDRTSPAARAAGIAWPADSGLNWDEKYAAWIQSLERTPGHETYYDTFMLATPWGKKIQAPSLECAETAMFLRATFSSWYELPFFMTAEDESGARVFFGHFGIRTKNGRYGQTPRYATSYRDYTRDFAGRSPEQVVASWPHDSGLAKKFIVKGSGDLQPFLGPDAHAGAYFDEIFLNKRAGHFILLLLDYFGSINVADSRNTYNLKPQALRAGDVLLERWQAQGIGHTLVTKAVTPLDGGKLQAELVSGSMPRRQGRWDDPVASKGYFTNEAMGGEGASYDGQEYVKLGGGLKRFRVAKDIRGTWTNTWMAADEASWISDDDWDRLKTRPKEFEALLGEVPPEQQRDSLLRVVEDARNHLRQYPASCSARENREKAFRTLYSLASRAFNQSQEDVDRQYRILDDYVFAELVYTQSKTCCWNSSTAAMYQIVVDYAKAQQGATCSEPVVFKASRGGYQAFADFAAQTGRALQWRQWSEDEPCAQRDVAEDLAAARQAIPWCEASAPAPQPE